MDNLIKQYTNINCNSRVVIKAIFLSSAVKCFIILVVAGKIKALGSNIAIGIRIAIKLCGGVV